MKIIIVYSSAGTGHQRAAESLYNCLKENCPKTEIQLIDTLGKTNIVFKRIYTYGYKFLVHYATWLWQISFWITYIKFLRKINKFSTFIIHRLNTGDFSKFLIEESPDYIISTHFLPSEVSAYLKRGKLIKSKIFTVITDFGVHPTWIWPGTDLYIVASDYTKEQLINQGVNKEIIKILGIPVDSLFLAKYKKEEILRKLYLKENIFTVLILTGAFGIGPIEKIVDLLHNDAQILVVCARNKNLFLKLRNKNYPQVKVLGYVDNVAEVMAVSDIIITKPGGLTISELLAMELVPVFISAIPGQETENARILEKCGIGVSAKNLRDVKDIILDFKEHPEKINEIKENIKKIKKPNPSGELCNVIRQDSFGYSGGRPL